MSSNKNTLLQLEYRIRHSNFGFVNGQWYYIHKRKPLFDIDIQIVDDPDTDKNYERYLEHHNPLSESF
jgi:hypothetical protein